MPSLDEDLLVGILGKLPAREVELLLMELGARNALSAWRRRCAVNLALDLLRQKTPRIVIRRRLESDFAVSTRSAYRLIEDALQARARLNGPGNMT